LEKAKTFSDGIRKIIYRWADQKCSQKGYSELVVSLEKLDSEILNDQPMREYFTIWAGMTKFLT